MEGVRCEEAGCGRHDFLPFRCPRCNHVFCLDHRSRFQHTCTAAADFDEAVTPDRPSKASSGPSVKEMFNNVARRFQGSPDPPAKSHTPIMVPKDEGTLAQCLHRLPALSASDSATAKQTYRMLVKRHAAGNSAIEMNERIYVIARRPNTTDLNGIIGSFFFPSYISLGEMLRDLRKMLPSSFPSTSEDTALCIYTPDAPDWRQWDRRAILSTVLSNFEEVAVELHPIDEIVHAQRVLEELQSTSSPTEAPALKKGDLAWYHRSNPPPRSFDEARLRKIPMSLIKIIAVHLDDFPNVYYTVLRHRDVAPNMIEAAEGTLLDFDGEKQTDPLHLVSFERPPSPSKSAPAPAPAPPAATAAAPTAPPASGDLEAVLKNLEKGDGPLWTIALEYRRQKSQVQTRSSVRLGTLRHAVAHLCGLPARQVKLIHRGSTLKADTLTLQDCGLGDKARIMVLG